MPAYSRPSKGGTVLAFYALIGFDDSVNVAEETQHPSRNYPRAMFSGLLAARRGLLITITSSLVVPTNALAESGGPLLEVVERDPLSVPAKLFAAIALLAVSNGALINLIMASRITYGMADQGCCPRCSPGFTMVAARRGWPSYSSPRSAWSCCYPSVATRSTPSLPPP